MFNVCYLNYDSHRFFSFAFDSAEGKDLLVDLAKAGARAPSWYNSQPWKFKIKTGIIEIYVDSSRDQSFFSQGDLNEFVACGAVIENIIIAAKARGFDAVAALADESSPPNFVASIRLFPLQSLTISDSTKYLAKALWHRHTNTLLYQRSPLLENDVKAIRSIDLSDLQTNFKMFQNANDKQKIFDVCRDVDLLRFKTKALFDQLQEMIQWEADF